MPQGKPTAKEIETVYPESVRKEDYAWERAVAESRARLTQELAEAKRRGRDAFELETRLEKSGVPPDVQHRLNIYKAQEAKYGHVLSENEPPAKKKETLTAAEAKALLFPDDSDTDIDEGTKADPFASSVPAAEPTNEAIVISDDSDIEVGTKEDPFLSAPAEQKPAEEKKSVETYNIYHVPKTEEEANKLLDYQRELENEYARLPWEERKDSNLPRQIDQTYKLFEKYLAKQHEQYELNIYLAQIKAAEEREAKEKAAKEKAAKDKAAKEMAAKEQAAAKKAAEEKAAESYLYLTVPKTAAEADKLWRHIVEAEMEQGEMPDNKRDRWRHEINRLRELYQKWQQKEMETAMYQSMIREAEEREAIEREIREENAKKTRELTEKDFNSTEDYLKYVRAKIRRESEERKKQMEDPNWLQREEMRREAEKKILSETKPRKTKKSRGGADFDDPDDGLVSDGDDFESDKPKPKKRKVERIVEEKVISNAEFFGKQRAAREHIGAIVEDIKSAIEQGMESRTRVHASVTRGIAVDIVNILMCLYTIRSVSDFQRAFTIFRKYLDDYVIDMSNNPLYNRAVWAFRHRHLEDKLREATTPIMRRKTPQGPMEAVDLNDDILEPLHYWREASIEAMDGMDEWKENFELGRILRDTMEHASSNIARLVIDIMTALSLQSPQLFQTYATILRQQLETRFDQVLRDRGSEFIYDEEYDTDDGKGPDSDDEAFIAPDDDDGLSAVLGQALTQHGLASAHTTRADREKEWIDTADAREDKERDDLEREERERRERWRKK